MVPVLPHMAPRLAVRAHRPDRHRALPRRLRRLRHRGDHWAVHKLLLWVLGWVVFMWLTSSGPAVYGRVTFSVHVAAHIALMTTVPILLVPASATTLALRALPARQDRTLGPRELLLAVAHSR